MTVRPLAGVAMFLALLATSAAFAQAAAGPGAAVHAACAADVAKLCPGVPKGHGEIMRCMKAHAPEVSPGCKQAMVAAHKARKEAAAAAAAAPAPAH